MAYTAVPTISTNDDWSAANHNMYVKDNFGASIPDIFVSKGDVGAGSAANALVPISGDDGQILEVDSGETGGLTWSLNYVPVGGIILWSAALGGLPSHWQICDGTNGTPDLRDQFVVGAGGSYDPDDTGGSDTLDWTHDHTVSATTSEDGPAHTHAAGTISSSGAHTHTWTTNVPTQTIELIDGVEDVTTHDHTHTFTTDSGNTHTHSIPQSGSATDAHTHATSTMTSEQDGSGEDIRPPYHALSYIMRIS